MRVFKTALPMTPRSLALLACLLATSFAAEAVSTTAQITAQSVLLGLQLSAKHRQAKGALPAAQNACIQALQPSEFHATTERVVTTSLSATELAAAEQFFSSVPGRKYATQGLLGIYTALGETPPEPAPALLLAESKAVEAFAATPAGQALLTRQVLQAPAAREAYDGRVRELIARCQAVKPDRAD